MKSIIQSKLLLLHLIKTKTVTGGLKHLPVFILLILFLLPRFSNGQAGDLSQIRNGDGKVKNGVLDACGDCWVNGNAGASNAHYREGYSIAYRSLITGLTAGTCYEYELGYDTYHGAMAIDYLTRFQRLEPHGPFGHPAEVINPLAMVSGSTKYNMTVIGAPSTIAIKAPDASGILTGVFDKNGNPKDVSNQAVTSFNALPAAERVMTMYNGVLQAFNYVSQAPIVLGGADAETKVRIRFMATSDSVVLAWGGHIASRLDWGYIMKQGKLVPLSAGGISGSPYHMRQKAFDRVTCDANAGNATVVLQNFSGFGNQDRSLAAAAVFPPPDCPEVQSQTKCLGSANFVFTIPTPQAEVTYTWSISNNTAGAAFQGGNNTGTSVTIVPSGAAFTAGSFTLNIVASLNGVPQECPAVATGTVVQVIASASANPTTIDITSTAHSTTLTADIAAGSSDLNNANYDYQWSIVTAGTNGSLTNATSRIATYTAGVLDAGTSITFKVIATQKSAPFCSDDETVTVTVTSVGTCSVSSQAPVCQGTLVTHTGAPSPKPSTATYTWVLEGYNGVGTTTSTFTNAYPNGGTTIQVNATQSYRIRLNEVYQNTAVNTSCYQDVQVVPTPTIATTYNAPACDATTFSVTVGSMASPVIQGASYSITNKNGGAIAGVSPASPHVASASDAANGFTFSNIPAGSGYIVTVTTAVASCTASSNCGTPDPPATVNNTIDQVNEETVVQKEEKPLLNRSVDTYNVLLNSPTAVGAAPNPFTDKVRFNINSGISGRGTLELYNSVGQKIAVVYEGYLQAGKEIYKEYMVPAANRNTLIYVLKVGDQRVTGKLINIRQ